ncbi:MAG: CDP-diacylglycerol--serine O-phosphatidyltransferase [Elusimicrobiales bacterium]
MITIEKLKRTGQVTLPSLFTIANIAFGFFAIISAIDKEFARAGWFIIGAMLMDSLDGRVARMVKGETKFGIEMDSLADFLSFGAAPALILYLFHLKDYGFWGYPVAFIYAMCGALRLARFNVMSLEGKSSKQNFTGLPIPGAAGILASFVIAYSLMEASGEMHSFRLLAAPMSVFYNILPFLMLGLGFLMVSTIPYAAFKQSNLFRPKTIWGLLFAVAFIFTAYRYPQDSLFVAFSLYVLSGLAAGFWAMVRKLLPGAAQRRTGAPHEQTDPPAPHPEGM